MKVVFQGFGNNKYVFVYWVWVGWLFSIFRDESHEFEDLSINENDFILGPNN